MFLYSKRVPREKKNVVEQALTLTHKAGKILSVAQLQKLITFVMKEKVSDKESKAHFA